MAVGAVAAGVVPARDHSCQRGQASTAPVGVLAKSDRGAANRKHAKVLGPVRAGRDASCATGRRRNDRVGPQRGTRGRGGDPPAGATRRQPAAVRRPPRSGWGRLRGWRASALGRGVPRRRWNCFPVSHPVLPVPYGPDAPLTHARRIPPPRFLSRLPARRGPAPGRRPAGRPVRGPRPVRAAALCPHRGRARGAGSRPGPPPHGGGAAAEPVRPYRSAAAGPAPGRGDLPGRGGAQPAPGPLLRAGRCRSGPGVSGGGRGTRRRACRRKEPVGAAGRIRDAGIPLRYGWLRAALPGLRSERARPRAAGPAGHLPARPRRDAQRAELPHLHQLGGLLVRDGPPAPPHAVSLRAVQQRMALGRGDRPLRGSRGSQAPLPRGPGAGHPPWLLHGRPRDLARRAPAPGRLGRHEPGGRVHGHAELPEAHGPDAGLAAEAAAPVRSHRVRRQCSEPSGAGLLRRRGPRPGPARPDSGAAEAGRRSLPGVHRSEDAAPVRAGNAQGADGVDGPCPAAGRCLPRPLHHLHAPLAGVQVGAPGGAGAALGPRGSRGASRLAGAAGSDHPQRDRPRPGAAGAPRGRRRGGGRPARGRRGRGRSTWCDGTAGGGRAGRRDCASGQDCRDPSTTRSSAP